MGSWSDWKLVEHLDEELDTASTNAVQNKVVATKINDVETALDGKAPTSHASSSTMYGVGTSTEYGHLKVADNLTTTTSGTALSANQGKILNDKIKNLNIEGLEGLVDLKNQIAEKTQVQIITWEEND